MALSSALVDFFPPSTIETERLHLRRPRVEDAVAVFETYANDPDVTLYVTWFPHASIDETRSFMKVAVEAWEVGSGHRAWMIDRKSDGALLGSIGARVDLHGAAIGYVLGRAHWGQGYMTEAVRAVCEAALRDPRVYRVWAWCDVENVASARVMEKAGMQREGILRKFSVHPNRSDVPRDSLVYAMVREE